MAAKCQTCWAGVSARAAHAFSGLSRQVSAYRIPQSCNLGGMSMNIQRKNSAHHFHMQSEREQTLVTIYIQTAHQIRNLFLHKYGYLATNSWKLQWALTMLWMSDDCLHHLVQSLSEM